MADTKKRPKWLKWVIIGGIAAAVIALIVVLTLPQDTSSLADSFTKTTAGTGSVEVSVVADGYVKPDTLIINAPSDGTAAGLLKAGTQVKKGDVLGLVQPDADALKSAQNDYLAALTQLQRAREARPAPSLITAGSDGRIFLLKAEEDDDADAICQQWGQLMVLSTGGVKALLPDGSAAPGDKLTLTYNGKNYAAEAVQDGGKLWALSKSNAPIPGKEATISKDGTQIAAATLEMEKYEPVAGAGTVEKVFVDENDTVDHGDMLIMLTGSERIREIKIQEGRTTLLKNLLDEMKADGTPVPAPMDGWVKTVNAKEGEPVKKMQPLFTMESAVLNAVVSVDETDVGKLKTGDTATMQYDTLPGQISEGKVALISGSGMLSGETVNYDVTISLGQTAGLLPGMSCHAKVLVANKDNVLRVPTDAILDGANGEKIVMVATGDVSKIADYSTEGSNLSLEEMMKNAPGMPGTKGQALQSENRTVTTGLANEYWTEITSGLSAGEIVLIPGSQSSSFSGMMRGFGAPRQNTTPAATGGETTP